MPPYLASGVLVGVENGRRSRKFETCQCGSIAELKHFYESHVEVEVTDTDMESRHKGKTPSCLKCMMLKKQQCLCSGTCTHCTTSQHVLIEVFDGT